MYSDSKFSTNFFGELFFELQKAKFFYSMLRLKQIEFRTEQNSLTTNPCVTLKALGQPACFAIAV